MSGKEVRVFSLLLPRQHTYLRHHSILGTYLHHGLILNAHTLFSFSSVNGSPVEQIDRGEVFLTAKKRRGEGRVNFANDSSIASIPEISIGIGVGNGETIDLSDPNQRKNLNREQKTFAMQQLMAIQEQMNKLMADF